MAPPGSSTDQRRPHGKTSASSHPKASLCQISGVQSFALLPSVIQAGSIRQAWIYCPIRSRSRAPPGASKLAQPRPVLPQPRTLRVTPASALNSQGPSRPRDGPSSLRSSGVTSSGCCPQVPCPPPPSDHTGTVHYWADPGGQVKAAHGGGSGVPPAPVGFWVSWARPPALALPQESFTSGRVSEPPRSGQGEGSVSRASAEDRGCRPSSYSGPGLFICMAVSFLSIYLCICLCLYLSIYLSILVSIYPISLRLYL